MKRYILATISALSLLAVPFIARAEDTTQQRSKQQLPQGQMGQQQGQMGQQQGGFQNRHIIMGEVTLLDKQSNEVTIRTQEGEEMKLHFPASALTNIKQGDRVAVELALRPVQPGMEGQQQGQQPEGSPRRGTPQQPGSTYPQGQ